MMMMMMTSVVHVFRESHSSNRFVLLNLNNPVEFAYTVDRYRARCATETIKFGIKNCQGSFIMIMILITFRLRLLFAAPYIKQCKNEDPQLLECLKGSLHHLKPYLSEGIPEIEVIKCVVASLKCAMCNKHCVSQSVVLHIRVHKNRRVSPANQLVALSPSRPTPATRLRICVR